MKLVLAKLTKEGTSFVSRGVEFNQVKPNHVLVKVCAASVKPLNSQMIKFLTHGDFPKEFPALHEFSGRVLEVGDDVTRWSIDDNICGIVSPFSETSACADVCEVHELDLVKVPSSRSDIEAVSCLGSAVKAYTSLIYQGQITAGAAVLIMSGAGSDGIIATQLALKWGAKVLVTVCGDDERRFVEKNHPDVAQVIDIGSKNSSLVSVVMEETGGMGVNVIIDDGVQMFISEENDNDSMSLPSKHDIISCLAVNGKWVTSQADLQIDPPDSQLLYMRNASVCYLNEYSWIASKSQHGKYLHILNDIMDKLATGVIKSHVLKTVQFADADEVLSNLPARQIGMTVMYMN